jgi:ferrous-iron efflux pump FieF
MTPRGLRTTTVLGVSLATACTLAVAKLVTGFLTQSMAVLASALDSLLDAGASAVNLIAAREAAKPPDEDHDYGHGKIESLAGLLQSQLIMISGIFILVQAVRRFFSGGAIQALPLGIGVMAFAIVATAALVLFLKAAGRQNPSLILAAERVHFSMDLASHLGVIGALSLVRATGTILWDLVISALISCYVFISAFRVLRRSVDELLDRSLGPVRKEEIEHIIQSHHPAIVGIHDFRSRAVGGRIFLDFHIEIRGVDAFVKAHTITESLIGKIKERYPGADVTVHYDPEGADDMR